MLRFSLSYSSLNIWLTLGCPPTLLSNTQHLGDRHWNADTRKLSVFSGREGAGTVSLACSMQYSRVGGLGLTEGHVGGFGGDWWILAELRSSNPWSLSLSWCYGVLLPVWSKVGYNESRLCMLKTLPEASALYWCQKRSVPVEHIKEGQCGLLYRTEAIFTGVKMYNTFKAHSPCTQDQTFFKTASEKGCVQQI